MKYQIALIGLFLANATLADTLMIQIVDQDGKPLPDVVAVVTGEGMPTPEAESAIVNQIDETFVPRVSVVPVGSSVNFPNQDQILHHVYSFSPAKTFEVPLYAGTPAEPVVFDQPGTVVLGCNIHDWMQAWVVVTDSPWAGVTAADGSWQIEGLDPGSYELQLWHPDERRASDAMVVVVEGETELDLELEVRPALNLRGLPGGGSGYF